MREKWHDDLLKEMEFLERIELIKIKSIAINGDRISLTWDEINDSDTPYKRSLKNGTGITKELIHLQKSLHNFIRNYMCIKISKDQICYISINKLSFKEKTTERLVSIKLTLTVNNSRDITVSMPWTPLYNFDRDEESNSYSKPYPQQETEILKKLELEAKYYIEGKRGDEKKTLFTTGDK